MKVLLFCAAIVLLNFVAAQNSSKKSVVCYFTSWATYRIGNGAFNVKDIDTNLCTHINYLYIGVFDNASIEIRDEWESGSQGLNGFNELVDLKKINPDIKILATIGGTDDYALTFARIAANQSLRESFANNVVGFLEEHKFDGLDVDWPNPTVDDKDGIEALLQTLNGTLRSQSYILSVAVNGNRAVGIVAYNVTLITDLVDMVNVKTYDYHGSWDGAVGHSSPLFASPQDAYIDLNRNVDVGINYWLKFNNQNEKIIMGIPAYGRSYTLAESSNTSLYAPITGGGVGGPYNQEVGLLAYNEICEFYSDSNYVFDQRQAAPHRTWDDQWVGYDDNNSLEYKLNMIGRKGMGGVMLYTIDYDDFSGICGEKYPLLSYINSFLNS